MSGSYDRAVWRQQKPQRDRFRREHPVNPERITAALESICADGPGVDIACGGEEPMVDEWEAGTRVPTFEQIDGWWVSLTRRSFRIAGAACDDWNHA